MGRAWSVAAGRALAAAAVLAISVGAAGAATIHVDQDSAGGICRDTRSRAEALTLETPLCTVRRGIAVAAAGDTLLVRRGLYRFSSPLWLDKAGLQLRAFPGERPVLDFSDQPSTISTGIGVGLRAPDVLLEGFEILGTVEECVQTYADRGTIRNNDIHDCGLRPADGRYQGAVQLGDSDSILIEGNEIHGSGSHVVYVLGSNVTIRNNLIYRTIAPGGRGSYGIQIGTDGTTTPGKVVARNVRIVHNAIGESVNRSGIVLYAPSAVIDTVEIVNNILYGNAQSAVLVYEASGTFRGRIDITHNILAGNAGGNCIIFDSGCRTSHGPFTVAENLPFASEASLLWTDRGGHDFHLLPGSPAIDRAASGHATVDRDGVLRPQGPGPDIGPYEQTARTNQAPVIGAYTASPASGPAPLSTTLTCTASDPDGDPLSYTLRFGDGTPDVGEASAAHVYGSAGSYSAVCTVEDGSGETATASRMVLVEPRLESWLYEAEDFLLSGFTIERAVHEPGAFRFDGIRVIPWSSSSVAQTNFAGPAGAYDVALSYVTEEDGRSTLAFSLGSGTLETFRVERSESDGNPRTDSWTRKTRVYRGVRVLPGDPIRIEGQPDGSSWARVDAVTLTPSAALGQPPVASLEVGGGGLAPFEAMLHVQVVDPDAFDKVRVQLDFGDGSTWTDPHLYDGGYGASIDHVYVAPGAYTACVSAWDLSGSAAQSCEVVEVR